MEKLDEKIISRGIIESYTKKLLDCLDNDVSIVGGGPAGLVCAYYLAKANIKVALFDRKLTIGGGMWGGGMLFNSIVVQEEGRSILDEFGIGYEKYIDGYYITDSIEATSTLVSKTSKAGVRIFNGIDVEDVVLKRDDSDYKVCGLVINWTTIHMTNLHVDPLVISSTYVVDGTGHEAFVANVLVKKSRVKLNSETGGVPGEKPLWASEGEKSTVEDTKEVFSGLVACGMAANNIAGTHRMGPIFGGMLLSGKKAAEIIINAFENR